VQLDVCVMCVDPDVWTHAVTVTWRDLAPNSGDGKKLLTPEEAGRFCQAMKSAGLAKMIAEPKLVTMCGRPASFLSGGQQLYHDFTLTSEGGKLVVQSVPKVNSFGTNVTFLADLMPEGIYLQCECANSAIRPIKEYKVTIEGPDGESRTEGVQLAGGGPVNAARIAAAVPAGKTLLLHCGRDSEGKDVIVTVTPQVISLPAVCAPPIVRGGLGVDQLPDPPMPAPPTYSAVPTVMAPPPLSPVSSCVPAGYSVAVPAPAPAYEPQLVTGQFAPPGTIVDPKLDRLLTKYRWACEDGEAAEARKLAQQCLAIDPTCFGK
jgi:hypothetical protein